MYCVNEGVYRTVDEGFAGAIPGMADKEGASNESGIQRAAEPFYTAKVRKKELFGFLLLTWKTPGFA